MARSRTIAILFVVMALGACSGPTKTERPESADPETVSSVIETHNARVSAIDTLWARVSVRVRGLDARGERFEEQGEGHLQIVTPDRASLTIGKLGETYFTYGANEERYWMFDLSDSDRAAALVGALRNVTRAKARALGLSVHPSDLVRSVGLAQIDPDTLVDARIDQSGSLVLTVPARWGESDLWFDPDTEELRWVVSLDDEGNVLARTELGRSKDLLEPNRLSSGVEVPGRVEITTPDDSDGYVRIELSEPTRKSIRPVVYDFERLKRVYRVDEVVDLDEDPRFAP